MSSAATTAHLRTGRRMADRPCNVSGCGGQLITRDDRTIACQKCGTIYNPRPWPVRRGSKLSPADLVGPNNYEHLR